MWQAARATTAIPTHFPPFRLPIPSSAFCHAHEVCLVDGSLLPVTRLCWLWRKRAFYFLKRMTFC